MKKTKMKELSETNDRATMMILSRGLVLLALPRTVYSYSPSSLGRSTSIMAGSASKRAAAGKPMRQSALNFSGVPAKKKAKAEGDTSDADKPFRIFCDLDGVLTDFDAGVVKLCGKPPSQISSGLLWSSIAKAGPSFFEDLAWCHDGLELWNAILPLRPTILTGCSRAAVAKDKAAWCKRELCVETNHVDMAAKKKAHEPVTGFRKQGGVTNVITCWSKNKHRESGPRRVLIDDREDLQHDWEAAGGIFILHTDTVSSLQQLREKGILKPQSDAKVAETPKDKELDVVATSATTEVDDEPSKIASKETEGMHKPQLETNVEKPKQEEPDVVATMTGKDEETSKVSAKETQGIPEPQSGTKTESSKEK